MRRDGMKVGILTYHRSVNYGAYLQALALCKRLNREQDISAEIIDFRMKCDERHYKYSFQTRQPKRILHKIRLNRTFAKSAELLPKSEAYPSSDSLDDFVKNVSGKYDILIAGSDEIWRTDTFRGFPNPYWLPGDLGCIKVAYAASAAKCCFVDMPEDDRSQLEALLKDFSYIGIRDKKTYDEISKLGVVNDKLHMCCDPSFVYDFQADVDRGKKLLFSRYHLDKDKKTILYMGTNAAFVQTLKSRFPGANILCVYTMIDGALNAPNLSPLEWVDVIAAVDFFVTEFFHGCCFSIINNIPFFAIETRTDSDVSSKLYNLLMDFDLLERYDMKYSKNGVNRMMELISAALDGKGVDYSEIVQKQRSSFGTFVTELRRLRV